MVTLGQPSRGRWIVKSGLGRGRARDRRCGAGSRRRRSWPRSRWLPARPSHDGGQRPMMSAFFVRRPTVAIVIAIVTVLGGPGLHGPTADCDVSRHRPAADHRPGDVHRRRRRDGRTVRRHLARAADERGRQHALHAVDQRERRDDAAHRDVRRRNRSECRSGQRSESRRTGATEPAGGSQPVRPHDAQDHRSAADGRVVALAREHVRRAVPRQLRQHQHHRRALSRAGRRAGAGSSAPTTTRCGSGSSPIVWRRWA